MNTPDVEEYLDKHDRAEDAALLCLQQEHKNTADQLGEILRALNESKKTLNQELAAMADRLIDLISEADSRMRRILEFRAMRSSNKAADKIS